MVAAHTKLAMLYHERLDVYQLSIQLVASPFEFRVAKITAESGGEGAKSSQVDALKDVARSLEGAQGTFSVSTRGVVLMVLLEEKELSTGQ